MSFNLPSFYGTQALYSAYIKAQADGAPADHGSLTETGQHGAMMNLVPRANATKVFAVDSGNWNNAANWYPNGVPGNGDNFLIGPGVSCVVDIAMPTTPGSPALGRGRLDGTMSWSRSMSTALLLDTFVAGAGAVYDMGTTASPIPAQYTAEMVFADNGPINIATDPWFLSRGAMWHDQTRICGATKTGFLHAYDHVQCPKGARSMRLEFMPVGWAVGDTIVIGSNRSYGYQYANQYASKFFHGRLCEKRVLTAVTDNLDGTCTVSWDDVGHTQDLVYSHVPPPIATYSAIQQYHTYAFVLAVDGKHYRSVRPNNTGNTPIGDNGSNWVVATPLRVHVINLTRNIKFRPQTPEVFGDGFHPTLTLNGVANYMPECKIGDLRKAERPHTMFMHNEDVDCRYAEFAHLGRTAKFSPSWAICLGDPISGANVSIAAGGFATLNGSYVVGGVAQCGQLFIFNALSWGGSATTILTVIGTDKNNAAQTEVIRCTQNGGSNSGHGKLLFKTVTSIQSSALITNLTAGMRVRAMALKTYDSISTSMTPYVQNAQESDSNFAPTWNSASHYTAITDVNDVYTVTAIGSDHQGYQLQDSRGAVNDNPVTNVNGYWKQLGVRQEAVTNLHNIQGRYPVHIHKTPLTGLDSPAVVAGCSIYDSPGWGLSHHSSHAIVKDNVFYDIQGAALVSEGGDETGLWENNAVIGMRAGNEDATGKTGGEEATLDPGVNACGMMFASRMVKVNGAFVSDAMMGILYSVRANNAILAAFQFDQPELLRGAIGTTTDIDDHHAIDHFYNGEFIGMSESGIEVIKKNSNQGHDFRTVLDTVLVWSTLVGVSITYTQHYTNRNWTLIRGYGAYINSGSPTLATPNASVLGSGFATGNIVSDQVFVNMYAQGFLNGFYADHNHTNNSTFEITADNDRTCVDFTAVGCTTRWLHVDSDNTSHPGFAGYDTIDPDLTSDTLGAGPTTFTPTTARPVAPVSSGVTLITGTKVDEIGSRTYPHGTDAFTGLFGWDRAGILNLLSQRGYWNNTADSKKYVFLPEFFSSRLTGEPFMVMVPMELPGTGNYLTGMTNNGSMDLSNAHAPALSTITASTPKNTIKTINVVGAATHPDGAAMILSGFKSSMHTFCKNNLDGTLTIYPTTDFLGTESLYVWVTDANGKSTRSTIALTMNSSAQTLTANNDSASTAFNTLVTFNVTANDIGTGITVSAATVTGGSGVGTVVNNNNGTLTFTPNSAFTGQATGTYTITDGVTSVSGGWSVNVATAQVTPDPPIVVGFSRRVVRSSISFNAMQFDTDPAGLPLHLVDFVLSNQSAGDADSANDGSASFSPKPDYSGTVTISYRVSNGSTSATGQIALTVAPRSGWGGR